MAASSKPCKSPETMACLVLAHCENGDVIDTMIEQALVEGHTTPRMHALTRPGWGGVESTLRVAGMASAAEANVYIVHT